MWDLVATFIHDDCPGVELVRAGNMPGERVIAGNGLHPLPDGIENKGVQGLDGGFRAVREICGAMQAKPGRVMCGIALKVG